jgi:hypothetical protein
MKKTALLLMGAVAFSGCSQPGPQDAAADPAQLAEAAMEQYQQADKQGLAGQKCVKAREAAAAFKQANAEVDFTIWKAIKEADCSSVGLPAN